MHFWSNVEYRGDLNFSSDTRSARSPLWIFHCARPALFSRFMRIWSVSVMRKSPGEYRWAILYVQVHHSLFLLDTLVCTRGTCYGILDSTSGAHSSLCKEYFAVLGGIILTSVFIAWKLAGSKMVSSDDLWESVLLRVLALALDGSTHVNRASKKSHYSWYKVQNELSGITQSRPLPSQHVRVAQSTKPGFFDRSNGTILAFPSSYTFWYVYIMHVTTSRAVQYKYLCRLLFVASIISPDLPYAQSRCLIRVVVQPLIGFLCLAGYLLNLYDESVVF